MAPEVADSIAESPRMRMLERERPVSLCEAVRWVGSTSRLWPTFTTHRSVGIDHLPAQDLDSDDPMSLT